MLATCRFTSDRLSGYISWLHRTCPVNGARAMSADSQNTPPPFNPNEPLGHSAERVLYHIKRMTKAERRRLGMVLAQNHGVLIGWRVVQEYDTRDVSMEGVSGMELRLFNYVRNGSSRERDIVRHLWPEAAEEWDKGGEAVRHRLRNRLRQLQFRTNTSFALNNTGRGIKRERTPQEVVLYAANISKDPPK